MLDLYYLFMISRPYMLNERALGMETHRYISMSMSYLLKHNVQHTNALQFIHFKFYAKSHICNNIVQKANKEINPCPYSFEGLYSQ